jgi:flavin-dependent dehydrogenase
MAHQFSSHRETPRPVILGAGLSGLAVSRALSAASIEHVLVGDPPGEMPRLGESLNAEGSLEIARQFPALARYFFDKQRVALFFGEHALAFESIQASAAPAYYALFGYPTTVPLLHVDRVGFDRALFEAAVADAHCLHVEGRAAALDYRPDADRIDAVELASGQRVASSYVFDATNHARFVARRLDVRLTRIGEPRRVVFAHYRAADRRPDAPPPWMPATSLLRLEARTDHVDGLAWCIPLGGYVSVGISVDPAKTRANPELLLDWTDKAYATVGIDVRGAFAARGTPVDLRYEHYTHARCYGRNWLLAGPSCCQVWFPSAAGVATGLIAARLAPNLLCTPAETGALYQSYMDQTAASHSMLDWLAHGDPRSVTSRELRQRSQAMVIGNVKRLARYLGLQGPPVQLAFGDAFARMYESDRLLASPLRIDAAQREALATRLFAKSRAADASSCAPIEAPVLTRPDNLDGPEAILGLIDVLAGRRDTATWAQFVAPDLRVKIDQFELQGADQWTSWVAFVRAARKVEKLDFVPSTLTHKDGAWILTGQWQGMRAGRPAASPLFSVTLTMTQGRVAAIATRRADYTFAIGDAFLPQVAFAALLGRLAGRNAAA